MFLDVEGWPIGTLDVSFGPPRAGVIELGDERDHGRNVARPAGFPCFTGSAVVTELVLRRCVRGKPLDDSHIRHAQRCWHQLPAAERERFMASFRARFRDPAANCLMHALSSQGAFPWSTLRGHLLRGALRARPTLLAEYAVDKAFFDRRPRQRERYAAGSRPSGTTVAIVGTDGTGKSSLVAALTSTLSNFGLRSEALYFGRVRSSMLLSDSMRQALERVVGATSIKDSTRATTHRVSPRQRALRRIASYVYVLDYAARLGFRVLPLWAKGNVIVLDRYVYDLRIMPHASALASRLAELIAPRPRLMFFLDVDAKTILSRRQERSPAEVVKQQAILRETCARMGAATRYVRVESTAPVRELAEQLARAAVATAHRREIGVSAVLVELLEDVERRLAKGPHELPPAFAAACHG